MATTCEGNDTRRSGFSAECVLRALSRMVPGPLRTINCEASQELKLLNEGTVYSCTGSAKIIDVPGYYGQVMNQCNRRNLFVYWMFMMR